LVLVVQRGVLLLEPLQRGPPEHFLLVVLVALAYNHRGLSLHPDTVEALGEDRVL
jgi:hypothetical protein